MPPDLTGSFKTHAGYLSALSYLCGYEPFARDPAVSTALDARIRAEPSYVATVRRTGFDEAQVRQSLNSAWGSELLLVISGTYAPDELKGVSNTWAAIQAYYACYHALQALVVARGQPRPSTHPQTQRMFIDAWVTPPRDLAPWSLGAHDGGYNNLPPGHVVDDGVHPWVTLDATSAIDVASKSFRTTREDFIVIEKKNARLGKQRERRRAWEAEEAIRAAAGRRARVRPTFALPQLTTAEHRAIESRTRAFGVLHYLYRLRIKNQYGEAEVFIDGPESAADSVAIFQHLAQVVRSTVMLHELFIERIVGRAVFERIVDDWLARQATAPVNPLADRRALIVP